MFFQSEAAVTAALRCASRRSTARRPARRYARRPERYQRWTPWAVNLGAMPGAELGAVVTDVGDRVDVMPARFVAVEQDARMAIEFDQHE